MRATGNCEYCNQLYTKKRRKQRFCSPECMRVVVHTNTLDQAFFSRIKKQPDGGCWLYTGYITPNGYGTFGYQKKFHYAHRFSYEFYKGPIPEGLEVDHLCKVRNCCNPDHLEAVTTLVNQHRANPPKDHCNRGHAFDEENTFYVKKGERFKRYCRACNRDRTRERKHQKLLAQGITPRTRKLRGRVKRKNQK